MLMFTLAISCLTTSNLPWFMDLTLQVPVQYCLYSIRLYFHQQSHPQLGIFSLWLCLFIVSGVISPLFSSNISAPTELQSSYITIIPFCIFILFMGFSRQEYWSGLPFPSPWDHVLSEQSAINHPSWVAVHGMSHSFTELDKAVVHVISLVSFLWYVVFILSALWWIRIRGLWKLPDGRDWLRGKLGLVLMGRAMSINL